MNIKYCPTDYASVYQKAVFGCADVTPDEQGVAVADIIVGNNIEALGQKLYHNRVEFDVNVAPFVQELVEVVPQSSKGFNEAAKRTVEISVRVGDDRSPRVILAAGTQALEQGVLLSSSKNRVIAPSQTDEIAFIPTSTEVWASITVTDTQGRKYSWREAPYLYDGRGVVTYGVDASAIMAEAEVQAGVEPDSICRIEVGILFEMTEAFVVVYEVKRSTQGVRLSWVNRYGAIDSYTFPIVNQSKIVTTDNPSAPKSAWRCLTISSDILPRQQIEWLAEVATARLVWMVEGDTQTPCEVLSDMVVVEQAEGPCAVKFVVKPTNELYA